MSNLELTKDWADYQRCKEYLEMRSFYSRNEKAYKFVCGEQWEKVPDGMPTPQLNILKPIVDYKVSTVLKSGLSLNFSNAEFDSKELASYTEEICSVINSYVTKLWEKFDMDAKLWEIAEDACIAGGAAIYTYYQNGELAVELKSNTDILFSDEQQELQKQKFIILPFRRMVSEIRSEAMKNGIPEDLVKNIVSDSDTLHEMGSGAKREVEFENETEGKCLCLLKLWKDEEGFVNFRKSTREVEYCNEQKTEMRQYPIAFLSWNKIKGGIRGKGDIWEWIPNQVEINKNLARIAVSVMQSAYPKMAYNENAISNPNEIMTTGALIATNGIEAVQKLVAYLPMQQISPDARNYVSDLITKTQDLSGANQFAVGNINPSAASGRAILAVQDAAAATLNKEVARIKKFVEDIGRVWWDVLAASNSGGIKITYDVPYDDGNGGSSMATSAIVVPADVVSKLKFNVKVDVSPQNTFSKFAVEQTLENFFTSGIITLEEYAKLLPDDSVAPKSKLLEVIEKRAEIQKLMAERDQYKNDYTELAGAMQTYEKLGAEMLSKMGGSNEVKGSSN